MTAPDLLHLVSTAVVVVMACLKEGAEKRSWDTGDASCICFSHMAYGMARGNGKGRGHVKCQGQMGKGNGQGALAIRPSIGGGGGVTGGGGGCRQPATSDPGTHPLAAVTATLSSCI